MVSLPGLDRISDGNGDLADVVQLAGDAQALRRRSSKPSSAPMATAISATRRSWPAVYGSRISLSVVATSTVLMNAV